MRSRDVDFPMGKYVLRSVSSVILDYVWRRKQEAGFRFGRFGEFSGWRRFVVRSILCGTFWVCYSTIKGVNEVVLR